jgi:cysteine desulfurase / selenocysteine lyase
MIYLDNAANSHPKPPRVLSRVAETLAELPDPGRGEGNHILLECRQRLARLFGMGDPHRVILTPGATYSLNYALHGVVASLSRPIHCLSSVLEHEAVLRPLRHLEREGLLTLDLLSSEELLCNLAVERRFHPETRLVALTAASQVTGQSPDLVGIGRLCQQRGAALVIDAAQAAGTIPLDMGLFPPRTLVALAGHKGLYGPAGTGALLVGEGFEDEELTPPLQGAMADSAPGSALQAYDRLFEIGAMNLSGLAGLSEGVGFVLEQGVDSLGKHRQYLVTLLIDLLSGTPGIRIFDSPEADYRCGILSFSLEPWDPRDLARTLAESYSIVIAGGLHAAPLAHHAPGCPRGCVRVSAGFHNSEEDVIRLVQAVGQLAAAPALAA